MMIGLIVRIGAALAVIYALIIVLALVISRALPGAGAIAFLSYWDGNPDIYVLDMGRRTQHNLTENNAVNGLFAFSPDGARIAFESNKDGNTELYMMRMKCPGVFDLCSGGIRQLTDDETDSRNPVWSPDGRQIAYVYDVSFDDSNNDIYVLDIESGEAFNLSISPANDESPAWSPDGSQIAFRSDTSMFHEYEIYVANQDGSQLRHLTEPGVFVSEFSWSPDGQHMVVIIYDRYSSNEELALVAADGGNLQILTDNLADRLLNPTWSLDSTRLAFITYAYEIPNELRILHINDDTIQQLASDVRYASPLTWSSDGRQLFFSITQEPVNGRTDEIWMVEVTRGSLQQLTFEGGASPVWWP
jgi:Tol biopolymer transport system component